MRALSEWKKVKDIFVKPKRKVFFGWWKNFPGLPVWREGYTIRLAKHHQVYLPNYHVLIKDKNGTYHTIQHKHITNGYVWRRDIRKKLKRFGLGWIKPYITFPWWTRVGVIDYDVCWKWKYDDIRFEYPPQFCVIIFGLCLAFTWYVPTNGYYSDNDSYWEGLLEYMYKYDRSMYETVLNCGLWSNDFKSNKHWISIRPEYISDLDARMEYCQAAVELRKQHKDYNII